MRFKLTLSLIVISLFTSFTYSKALTVRDTDNRVVIKLPPIPVNTNPHRTVVATIEASYLDGTITADFYGIDGIVTITIANTSTGEQIVEFVNASEGAALIDMYGMTLSGNFTISFLTSAGDLYSGTFSL